MYIGYEMLIDEPHELCQWAKEDIEKCYNNSCKKAIKDICEKNKQRTKAIEDAVQLGSRLMEAYDEDDRDLVADILTEIKKNVG